MTQPINQATPAAKWPDPTPDMLKSPVFEAIWQCIKGWDINVPAAYVGYEGATGNHVRAILDALASVPVVPGAVSEARAIELERDRDLLAGAYSVAFLHLTTLIDAVFAVHKTADVGMNAYVVREQEYLVLVAKAQAMQKELHGFMSRTISLAGVAAIACERARAIREEGHNPWTDRNTPAKDLVLAASCYLHVVGLVADGRTFEDAAAMAGTLWPLKSAWKPETDPLRNLAKAGSLLTAAYERQQVEKGGAS